MRKKKPLITLIVPVFNNKNFLCQCIKSILSQSYQNFELIVIDDGSKDSSLSIVQKFAKEDQRIRIIAQKHQGVSAARNAALEIAKGAYIMFVDADDYIEPGTLKSAIYALEKSKVDCLIFNYKSLQDDGCKLIDLQPVFRKKNIQNLKALSFINLTQITVWGKLFKNNAKLPRFCEHLKKLEDCAFLIEYYLQEPKIAVLDKPYYIYRQHSNAATKSSELALSGAIFESAKYALSLAKDAETKALIADRFSLSVLREINRFFKNQAWPKEYKESVYRFLINSFCIKFLNMPSYCRLCNDYLKQISLSLQKK